MKVALVLFLLVLVAATVAVFIMLRKRNSAKKISSSLGTSTYQSKTIPGGNSLRYSGEVYTLRTKPRYDYSKPVTKAPYKPAKDRSDDGEVAEGYVNDTNWYTENTYQAPSVDTDYSRTSYTSESTQTSYNDSSYGAGSPSSSGGSSYSSDSGSSSSYDSGSY